jgi:pimeloyl-ACP methyl ester carboxylesterase
VQRAGIVGVTVGERIVRSADGTGIRVWSVGKGPALVLVHGSGMAATDYRRLATRLASTHRVHRYDRRGRGGVPRPREHSLAVDVADLVAVVHATAARAVLGHDFGALVALQAAKELALTQLLLLDPRVDVDGCLPTGYVPRFADALALRELPLAFARRRRGLRTGLGADLPLGLQRALGGLLLNTRAGRRAAAMLPADLDEDRQVAVAAGPGHQWADVEAPTLLAVGGRSPDYLVIAAQRLAEAMPNARYVVIPGAGHDAAVHARRAVVDVVLGFLDPPTALRS